MSLQELTKEQVSYVLEKNNLGCLIETFSAYDGRNLAEDFDPTKISKPDDIPTIFWDAFWKRLGKWKQGQLEILEASKVPKALGKVLKTFLKKQNASPLLHDVLAQNNVLSLSDFKRLQDQPEKFEEIQKPVTQIDIGKLVDTANAPPSFADRANAFHAQKALFGSFILEQEKVLGELEKRNEQRLTAAETRLTDNLNSARLQMEKTLDLEFSKLSENRKELMAQVAMMKAEAVKGMNAVLEQQDVLPQEQATHFQLDRGILLLPNGRMEIKQKLFSTCDAYFTTKGELKTFDSHKELAAMREISTNLVLSGFAGLSMSAKVGGAGFVGGGLGAFAASSSATLTTSMESTGKISSGTQSRNIYSTYSENIKIGEVCIDFVDAQKAFSRSMRITKEFSDISKISDESSRRKKIFEWMSLNGSHVSLKVDVGGQAIREYDAFFKTDKAMSEKRHLMGIVVGAHAGVAGGFFCPAGGGGGGSDVKTDASTTAGSLRSTNTELEGTSFSQRRLRNGGDPRVSIDLWKTSIQYKRNMVVINRYTDHVFPIWQLFPAKTEIELKNEFKEVWINKIMLEGKSPRWVKTMQELNEILCPEDLMSETILWGCTPRGTIVRAKIPSDSTSKQLPWQSVMDGKDFVGDKLDVSYNWVYCVTDKGGIMRKSVGNFGDNTWEQVTWSVEDNSDVHPPCTCVNVTDNEVYFANEKLLWRANADSPAKNMPCDELLKIESFTSLLKSHFERKELQLHWELKKLQSEFEALEKLARTANNVAGVANFAGKVMFVGTADKETKRKAQNLREKVREAQKNIQDKNQAIKALQAKAKRMTSNFKIIQICACNVKQLYVLDNHGNIYQLTKDGASVPLTKDGPSEGNGYHLSARHINSYSSIIQNIAVSTTGDTLWTCDITQKIWRVSTGSNMKDMKSWKRVPGQADQIHVSNKWILCCTKAGNNPVSRHKRKTAGEDDSPEWIVSTHSSIKWIVVIDK